MRTLPVVIVLAAAAVAGVLFIAASHHGQAEPNKAAAGMAPAAPAASPVAASAIDDDDEIDDDEDEAEVSVPLDRVPANVLEAAKKALAGFTPDSAEIDSESGSPVYDIHGVVDGETWEVEVAPDGKVLGTERDDD